MRSYGEVRGSALADVRVVELGERAAGAVLGMLLADQGAEVVRVLPEPRAATAAAPHRAVWGRGRRFEPADPATRDGLAKLARLVRAADIVIDARPAPAGPGPDDLAGWNPRLVYCALPDFPDELRGTVLDRYIRGLADPHGYAPDGVDPLIGALTAMHQVNESDERVSFNPLALPSLLGGLRAASAVVAALIARDRTGAGQQVEVSLFDAMLFGWGRQFVTIGSRTRPSVMPRLPLLRQYRCADGRYLQLHGNAEPKWDETVLRVLGHPEDLAELDHLPDRDEVFWYDRLESYLRTAPAAHWEAELDAADAAGAVCADIAEWMRRPHVAQAGLSIAVTDPALGDMTQPGIGVTVEDHSGDVGGSALQQGQRVAGAEPDRTGLPLADVRVVDLTILIAGPICGRVLAELGAEVVKVDDPNRVPSDFSWIDVNRGKTSALIDLKQRAGRAALRRMLTDSDVLLANFRPGKMAALGFGEVDLACEYPHLVAVTMNAYGFGGELSHRPGWEQLLQAATGIQLRRAVDGRPQIMTPWVSDYGCGLLAAYGTVTALYRRLRGQCQGATVRTSLAQAATFMQAQFHLDFAGRDRDGLGRTHGNGGDPLSGLYRCQDGWLCLHATEDEAWQALTGIDGLRQLADDPRFADGDSRRRNAADLTDAIAAELARGARDEWLAALAAQGVPAAPRLSFRELRDLLDGVADGPIVHRPDSALGDISYVEATLSWDGRRVPRLGSPSAPGQDSARLIDALGYPDEEAQRLAEARTWAGQPVSRY